MCSSVGAPTSPASQPLPHLTPKTLTGNHHRSLVGSHPAPGSIVLLSLWCWATAERPHFLLTRRISSSSSSRMATLIKTATTISLSITHVLHKSWPIGIYVYENKVRDRGRVVYRAYVLYLGMIYVTEECTYALGRRCARTRPVLRCLSAALCALPRLCDCSKLWLDAFR